MTELEKTRLAQQYAMYAAYYRFQIQDPVLKMYAEDLSDLPFDTVMEAMNLYRKNPKNRVVPLPAQIREMIEPAHDPDSESKIIAASIQEAISKFGWNLPVEAKEFLGETGWSVVQKFGGWQYLCERLGREIQIGTFQAQARDLAKAFLLHPEMKPKLVALPEAKSEENAELISSTDWRPMLDKLLKGQSPREESHDDRTGSETPTTL